MRTEREYCTSSTGVFHLLPKHFSAFPRSSENATREGVFGAMTMTYQSARMTIEAVAANQRLKHFFIFSGLRQIG